MKISYDELIKIWGRKARIKRFLKQVNGSREPVEVVSLIGGENTVSDLLWLAGRRLPKARIVTFAIGCARTVEHLNDDPRVKAAIDAAQAWVDNPTEENRKAADLARADAAWLTYSITRVVAASANAACGATGAVSLSPWSGAAHAA